MNKGNGILVVDDDVSTLKWIVEILASHGLTVRPTVNGEHALNSIRAEAPELILLDVHLPGIDGFQICRQLQSDESTRGIPILFLSASGDADERVKGLALGAVDFISKPIQSNELLARVKTHLELSRLRIDLESKVRERTGELEEAVASLRRGLEDRRQAEEALRKSEERFSLAMQASQEALWDWDLRTDECYFSPAYYEILGYGQTAVVGTPANWRDRIHPEDSERAERANLDCIEGRREGFEVEFRMMARDGDWRWVLSRGSSVARDGQGRALRLVGTHVDITERKRAEAERSRIEAQLIQSQKLESVGRLAAGVAHDFNNLLTVILGNSAILLGKLHHADPVRRQIKQIHDAGTHAVSLTKQLLAFSRKQIFDPRVFDIAVVIRESAAMLQRLIGEDVRLETHLSTSIGMVLADPDQFHQVIMNLAVNARDAMPDGGLLTITATEAEVDGAGAVEPSVPPGSYAVMTVTDSGHGMDEATLQRIFEPFFTTKEVGRGTGLGLSTVHGIVRQSGGWITVRSEVGVGTSFKVFLPRAAHEPVVEATAIPTEPGRGGETILLVEDQESVRSFTKDVLTYYGYRVLEASGGDQAIQIGREHPDRIDMLLTDVILPGMNGKEIFDRLRGVRANLKILFISGYAGDVLGRQGPLQGGKLFLAKPFGPKELAAKVRELLDTPAVAG